MRDILAAEGYDTAHTRGGLYYSPFRAKERTPSFHIDDASHRWYDHGDPSFGRALTGKERGGGDVVAFVRLLKGYSFLEALDYLCRYNPGVVPGKVVDAITVPRTADRILADDSHGGQYLGTTITAVKERFLDAGLVCYAGRRGIPTEVLERYCREVYYDMRYKDVDGHDATVSHHAIGFPNSDGGWTLRYVSSKGGGKRSTGGGATLIDKDGRMLAAADAKATARFVIVFEGFMDFLSWVTDRRPGGTPQDTDIVVLNSVANLQTALPFILAHGKVIGLFDGDKAGDAATTTLCDACMDNGVPFTDCRYLLDGAKDYNDMWTAKIGLARSA